MPDDQVARRLDGTDALVALDAAFDAAWTSTDAALLALCRDRIAMLLRHAPTTDAMGDAEQADLRAWPTSDRFGDVERAALEFTEQYIVDVSAITDDQAAPLCDALGDSGFATFVNALLVVEQRMTLDLVMAAVA